MKFTPEMNIKVGLIQVNEDLTDILKSLGEVDIIEGDVYNILLNIIEDNVSKVRDILNQKWEGK